MINLINISKNFPLKNYKLKEKNKNNLNYMSNRSTSSLDKSFKTPVKCTAEGMAPDLAIVIARIDKLQTTIDHLLELCLRQELEGSSSDEIQCNE